MKQYILAALMAAPLVAQAEEGESIIGDFNGDGRYETAWVVPPENLDDYGELEPRQYVTFIRFSDESIPPIGIPACIDGNPVNLGDLNDDGTDEIGMWQVWFTSCWHNYYIWTNRNGAWMEAVDPFVVHCNGFEEAPDEIPVEKMGNGFVRLYYNELNEDADIVTLTRIEKLR